MPNVDERVVSPNNRRRVLDRIQREKMARSASDYVRGSPDRFYEWLADRKSHAIPDGPPVWICGDCHLGNLGPTANAGGQFEIEIRDFDQTVVGNPAHDLVRLGLSLAAAAVVSDLPGVTIANILEAMIASYERAFEPGPGKRNPEKPRTVRKVNRRARKATWAALAEEDTEDENFRLPLGKVFWPLEREERRELERLFAAADMRDLVMLGGDRPLDAPIRIADAAYWRKGCSSLGHLRYAVLLQIGDKRDAREHCLMDLKEAIEPRAPIAPGADLPRDPAERVVAGARKLSPNLGRRMRPARILDRPIFVRELLPQDLKIEIPRLDRREASLVSGYLAAAVGRAHAGQLDPAARKSWRSELRRARTKAVDAPSWLWRSVVDLLLRHQQGYLEHCLLTEAGMAPSSSGKPSRAHRPGAHRPRAHS